MVLRQFERIGKLSWNPSLIKKLWIKGICDQTEVKIVGSGVALY